jgi:hypothetical protein
MPNGHECEICRKRFTQKGTLLRHKNTIHLRQKEHKCEICGKSFGRKGNLSTHRKTIHFDLKKQDSVAATSSIATTVAATTAAATTTATTTAKTTALGTSAPVTDAPTPLQILTQDEQIIYQQQRHYEQQKLQKVAERKSKESTINGKRKDKQQVKVKEEPLNNSEASTLQAQGGVLSQTSRQTPNQPVPTIEDVKPFLPSLAQLPSCSESVSSRAEDVYNDISEPLPKNNPEPSPDPNPESIVDICFFCDEDGDLVFQRGSLDDFRRHLWEHFVDQNWTNCPIECGEDDLKAGDVRLEAMHFFEKHQYLPKVCCHKCRQEFLLETELSNHACK